MEPDIDESVESDVGDGGNSGGGTEEVKGADKHRVEEKDEPAQPEVVDEESAFERMKRNLPSISKKKVAAGLAAFATAVGIYLFLKKRKGGNQTEGMGSSGKVRDGDEERRVGDVDDTVQADQEVIEYLQENDGDYPKAEDIDTEAFE